MPEQIKRASSQMTHVLQFNECKLYVWLTAEWIHHLILGQASFILEHRNICFSPEVVTDGTELWWDIKQFELADVPVVPEVAVVTANAACGLPQKALKKVSDVELLSEVCLGGRPAHCDVCWSHAIHQAFWHSYDCCHGDRWPNSAPWHHLPENEITPNEG